jgi:hypothetical protein
MLVSYFFAASLRCQASSVAGKTSAQRLRGMSRATEVNHTRSAARTVSGQCSGAVPRFVPEHQLRIFRLVPAEYQDSQAE